MPIYEYSCNACGMRVEIRQSIHDASVNACSQCGGTMRRVFSGGGGFLIKNADSEASIRTHCGKTQTCCGSSTPCETPSCKNG